MSTDAPEQHPQVTNALEQLQRFSDILEEQMQRSGTGSFTASDRTNTVTATIDGHQLLTNLFIEDGLLRLGAETVEERINEALLNAHVAAASATEEQQHQVITALFEIAEGMLKSVES
jgi:DNA-binding protein YbaB